MPIVDSVACSSPTRATLNITALAAGSQVVTIHQSWWARCCHRQRLHPMCRTPLRRILASRSPDGVTTARRPRRLGHCTQLPPAAERSTGSRSDGGRHLPGPAHLHLDLTWALALARHREWHGQHQRYGSSLPVGASTIPHGNLCPSVQRRPRTLSNTATVTVAGDPIRYNDSATEHPIPRRRQANLGITETGRRANGDGSADRRTYTITAPATRPEQCARLDCVRYLPGEPSPAAGPAWARGGTARRAVPANIADTVNSCLPGGSIHLHGQPHDFRRRTTGTLS